MPIEEARGIEVLREHSKIVGSVHLLAVRKVGTVVIV